MILVIDNFDSFTYNIVAYYENRGIDILVKRNNEITIEEIKNLDCSHIILSPGPKSPKESPFLFEVLDHFKGKKKILGICLGHQAIGEYFGGKIIKAKKVCHGKVTPIIHEKKGVFSHLESPAFQTRYHSLVIDSKTLPGELEVTAVSADGDIMGVRHKIYDIEGVQFHPESVASRHGEDVLSYFINGEDREEESKVIEQSGLLRKIAKRENLSVEESQNFMDEIAKGRVSQEVMSAFLMGLSVKHEVSSEITGFVKSLLNHSQVFSSVDNCIDIVGTGGDKSGTFNISSVSSLVVASCGVPVAKHGNRSVSSKCGSADVLEELGIKINIEPSGMEESLKKVGMAFLFAPIYHESMKKVAGVRKALKIKTVFNILGPLVNPSHLKKIMIGVYDKKLINLMGDVLIELKYDKAIIVNSRDGLDEVSLFDKTDALEITVSSKKEIIIDPKDYGFANYSASDMSDITGGDKVENAKIALGILDGSIKGAKRDIILLNSGVALYIAEKAKNIEEGISMAREAIETKKALGLFEKFREVTNEYTR